MLAFLLNFLKKIFVICLATKKPCRVPSFISCYEVKLGHFSNLYFSLGDLGLVHKFHILPKSMEKVWANFYSLTVLATYKQYYDFRATSYIG